MISPIRDSSIKLVSCSRALSKSGLNDVDYALNPYYGCAHGCLYCYAPDVTRCRRGMEWGGWVEAKTDISRRLRKEIGGIGKSVIGLATVTDPYQPAEEQLGLTRACLEIISESDASLMLMTKSPLILRDIGLIEKTEKAEVCVTVTTLDDGIASLFENKVAGPEKRLKILKSMSERGISTDAMVSPLLLSEGDPQDQIEEIIEAIKATGCKSITFDKLRLRDTGRARLTRQYSGTAFENEVNGIVGRSENIDLEALIQSIMKNNKHSEMKIHAPMLF